MLLQCKYYIIALALMGVEVERRGGERKEGGVIQEDEHIFGLKADLLQCSKLSPLKIEPLPSPGLTILT